jgi:hypothetical protein
VPSWGSYSYAFGPIMAVLVLGGLVVLLRWAFRRGQSVVAAPPRPGDPLDYGLLVPVATPPTTEEARATVERLRRSGIRSSTVTTTDGLRVMVWPGDAVRAHQALESQPGQGPATG